MLLPRPLLRATLRGLAVAAVPERPVLAQMVVIRRCNLACGYCTEFDAVSPPVATTLLERRIDHVADLGTLVLTLTGGEPLLHPDLDRLVARAVGRGLVTTAISNAYAVTRSWIDRLNDAGLTALQVSVDNLAPNEMSQKSWSQVLSRLELLSRHARFAVNLNAVLGSSPPAETRALVAAARALGFFMTVGVMHDGRGQLEAGLAGPELRTLWDEMHRGSRKSLFHAFGEGWESRLLERGEDPFKCRAGGRYLYIDEAGIVSYCSARRGEPGIDIFDYTAADIRRENATVKGCESRCAIACVRRASSLDGWRAQSGPRVAPAGPSTS